MKELVLATLRKNIEQRTSYDDAGKFGIVFLENVFFELAGKITRNQFAGFLSVLRTEGKYKQLDGFFGEVLLETPLTDSE